MRYTAALCCLAVLAAAAPAPSQTTASSQGSHAAFIASLRAHVKHVFVIYQENRSFDSYFGTFPGAENLASADAQTHGFRQYDPLGNQWVTPFRITSADTADANHTRPALITKADDGRMDLYVATEEFGLLARGYSRTDAQRIGLLTMAHEDCDTIPFLWKYARTFPLFDRFFQAMYGPSTPGNLELIGAQTGQTQWAKNATQQTAPSDTGAGVPVVDDEEPAFGPYAGGAKPSQTQIDLKYATVLLTLSGAQAVNARDDADQIRDDIASLRGTGRQAVPWGWYQEGYADGKVPSSAYVSHHNALQYFGYLRDNAYYWQGVHDLRDLLPAIAGGRLGDRSVIFIKGGAGNPFGWKPADKSPYVQANFAGDDDHPGYADSQLSESLVATAVNAIARSKYWNDSAILIAWDDSEGFYDHVSPPPFERCPDGHACGDGARVPAIMISPYARAGGIISDVSDHTSFVKFLSTLFDLPALSSLPDEAPYMPQGPRDGNPALSDLTGAFDPARLDGSKPPIPATDAQIPDEIVDSFPAKMSCSSLGITPVTIPGSQTTPAGFAPLTAGQ